VDSVPIAERALARRAGLGFIGRSRMLINPDLGGRLLLGELITDLELEPDVPLEHPGCGDCRTCIEACPNGALGPDGGLDARKCVSYLTIEHKENFESGINLNGSLFGCDACLDACPYNQRAGEANPNLQFRPEWTGLTCQQIFDLSESDFALLFDRSGVIRLGLERLKRNCRAVMDLNVSK
jgi:epoxyqueuosine reductase